MTADLFDRLQTIKDRCDAHLEKAAKQREKSAKHKTRGVEEANVDEASE